MSYFVISGSALMRASVAPRRILWNVAGSEETWARVECVSSFGDGIKSSFPARFQAVTLPDQPSAVVFASSADNTVDAFDKFDRLRRVNETPGPLRAVIKVPT